ncbi:MAG: (d)CMP kinase [Actinomycetota bacterium]
MTTAVPQGTVVAIDGPAGAGKSTVGRRLATVLGLGYLDTGAMYRAVTVAVLRRGVDPSDDAAVAEVSRTIDLQLDDHQVVVDGVDVTVEIRGRDVTGAVSAVAANSAVRRELVARQRAWVGDQGGAVVEGRDIGTVVFPHALLKAYVTASPRVRAERRVAEIGGSVDDVEASIVERDRKDSSRADSPLRAGADAVTVDTSDLPIEAVVEELVGVVRLRIAAAEEEP